jgi:hypothetical protein
MAGSTLRIDIQRTNHLKEEDGYEQEDSGIFIFGNLFNPRDPAFDQNDHPSDEFIRFCDCSGGPGRNFAGFQRGETVELLRQGG